MQAQTLQIVYKEYLYMTKKIKKTDNKTDNLFLNILALFSKKQLVPQIVWEQRCYSPILLHQCSSTVPGAWNPQYKLPSSISGHS